MRTKGEKRIAHWMVDFRRWAEKSGPPSGRPGTEAENYAHGVLLAIMVSQRKLSPFADINATYPSKTDFPSDTARGYNDGIALLNKVVEYGDAPEGDFLDLLAEPWGKPLGERWD